MGKTSKNENSTIGESNVQSKQKFKRKSNVIAATMTTEDVPIKEKRVKKKKNNVVETERELVNKKIIFQDDVPVEVKVECKASAKSDVAKEKSQLLPDDEAAVRDEDIDAFCDELDEEDNAQFDNWVKLIEEKLNSSNKKKKNK